MWSNARELRAFEHCFQPIRGDELLSRHFRRLPEPFLPTGRDHLTSRAVSLGRVTDTDIEQPLACAECDQSSPPEARR